MISSLISRLVILVFGTLYPAYRSYKAVKTKNVKEYVKWMMYWIVFALFITVETFSDVFLSWLPFYYEIKIVFVIWLLSPATRGSSILYRKFVHPQLLKREKDIDEAISQATDKGCTALLSIGSRGFNLAATTVLNTAMKGQTSLVDHLRRSYSMSDISDPPTEKRQLSIEETIDETDNRYSDEFELRSGSPPKDTSTISPKPPAGSSYKERYLDNESSMKSSTVRRTYTREVKKNARTAKTKKQNNNDVVPNIS